MTTEQYGPGKNGWPAHGFSGSPFMKLRCYCDEEFTSKMALNRHVEAEVVAAERARIAAEVRWTNPMMTHPAAVKAVAEFRAMLLALLDPD